MPFTPTLSEEAPVAEIRTTLSAAADYLVGLRNTPADQRGDTYADDVRSAVDVIHELDPILTARERSAAPEARGGAATSTEMGEQRWRSPGELFTDSEVYDGHRGSYGADYAEHQVRGSIASTEVRALLAGGATTITWGDDGGVFRPLGAPILPQARQQRLFIRDVLNVIPTTLGAIPYVRELNAATNETSATAVAEGAAKAEATIEFEAELAPVVKIAAWVPVTTEIIEDAPTLQGYINTRLSYMVALREEAQVLNGPGTGPNMKGIRKFTVQTQASIANDFPAVIGLSIAKIENVDGEADFVAANPLDYWVAVTTRHANQFDNGFGGNAPAVQSSITWGLPAIRTRSMESGKALVGSRMGATIADRMQTVIRVGNQHGEYFVQNKVAVLAEERVALLVHRADFFVEASVPTS